MTDADLMPLAEQRLRAMIEGLQGVARELGYEMRNNLLAEAPPAESGWYDHLTRLCDAAEILSEWDPDEAAPEDGYEILFTTCDNCERLVQPVVNGTAELLCRWCED